MANYTDKQLEQATQIAYSHLGDAYDTLKESTGRTSFTLKELKAEAIKLDPNFDSSNLDGLSEQQMNTWSISGKRDTNDTTGFYACVVDTGDGNAILAFRGSELLGTDTEGLANLQHDWIEADLGILNSDGVNKTTNQYTEAREFLKQYKDLISEYKSVDLTGHSLGGNLAAFSTIVAEEYGMGSNFARCTNFDGPGFSKEFLERYSDSIERNASKIDHFKWSLVGSILHDLPGENSMFVKVKLDAIKNPLTGFVARHSSSSIDFDENGNVQQGKQDFIAFLIEGFTIMADGLPKPLGNMLSKIVGESIMFGMEHPGITIAALVTLAVTHPHVTAVILTTAVVVLACEYIGEFAEWAVEKIVNFTCMLVSNITEWAAEKIAEFCNGIKKAAEGIVKWFKSRFDKAYKNAQNYLANNTVVKLHTDDLRNLAERLWSVNGRLESLDHRLDRLYKQVKWTDLKTILTVLSADLRIGWSSKINNCAHCLNDTAARFEGAEQQILSMMG